ncbi:MAG: alpha/beta hydrolase-fold protein [Myxococcota bacterium]
MSAIDALLHNEQLSDEDIDRFVQERAFPIIEGRKVTFVYRGAADGANLRHFIFGLPRHIPFQRIQDRDVWFCQIDIPMKSRVEYKIEVIQGERRDWIRDPLNPHFARDPFGANSVCQGEGYETPEWSRHDEESRPGSLEELTFTGTPWGDHRRVQLYLPARFRRSRRYPLLIVHDGGDYVKYAALKQILDNLIHRDEVAPLIAALSFPVDRLTEYPDDENHARFIAEQMVPELERKLPLYGTPSSRCLMGASFGAVASLSTAWRHPGMFGRLLLQSGSFAFTDIGNHHRGPAFDPVVTFVNAFRDHPGKPSERVFMSCGQYESLIYENRSMYPFLQETGMEVRYTEARDGHNWENWRDRLREGLSWLFPGRLWMVYE